MVEKAVSLVSVIFALFFLVATFQIEGFNFNEIGTGTWPFILMSFMLLMGIILIFDLFSQKDKEKSTRKTEDNSDDDDEALIYKKNLWYMIFIFAGYSIALPYLGFLVTSIALMFILTILFGMKKWWHRILTAVVSSTLFVIVFPMLLNIPFPRGVGVFREISILFY